jgi:hypothetical protein
MVLFTLIILTIILEYFFGNTTEIVNSNHLSKKKKTQEESYLFPILEVLQIHDLKKFESFDACVFRPQFQVTNYFSSFPPLYDFQ